ncbi:MAG TPA: hypothetical protein VGW75_11215 [Solirubrobacteraceae bacterium]|jgi:hypothetical protein|nr:hypothetical protein [Solirubrobacteraceae bacterium]
MRKALATLGSGRFAALLDVALPTFRDYASRHAYELRLGTEEDAAGRPLAWAKVPLLRRLADRYEVVLWLDADCVVVDGECDVAGCLGDEHVHALVRHRTDEGEVPNTGVWLLRGGAEARELLGLVWDCEDAVEHRWWENAAVCRLLGYETDPVCRLVAPTPLYRRTRWLPKAWNSIVPDPDPQPRIVHLAGTPFARRRRLMRAALREAAAPRAGRDRGGAPVTVPAERA